MNSSEIMELEHRSVMQTYGRLPIVIERGENAVFYDADGKRYIDFTSGIGVNALGSCSRSWTDAVKAQLDRFAHCSNYYYTEPCAVLASKLTERSGMSCVFFGNSGAEANECAIKVARKYSFDRYGEGRSVVLTLNRSFHGRTMATLTATGQEQFHRWFAPFLDGVRYADPDMDSVAGQCRGDVCGILLEPIQGESGVYPMDPAFLRELRSFCDSQDILLMFDEVQCGMGRTGRLFAFENYGVVPDVVTLAKGLGGGLPIGACLCGEKAAGTLGKGMHGSTFGGNPVVCAGANAVLDSLTDGLLADVARKGALIREAVFDAAPKHVTGIRGMGLMIGIVTDVDPHGLLLKAAERGLLVLTAGKDVVRLLPPLTITDGELQEGLQLLVGVLNE